MNKIRIEDFFKMNFASILRIIRPASLVIHGRNTGGYFLVISLFLILFVTAGGMLAACTKTTPSDTSGSSMNQPTESPAPTLPPEIIFDMSGDQSSIYLERLFIDASASSISIIGGNDNPVHMSGKIANCEAYCYSQQYAIDRVEYAIDGSSLAILLDSNLFDSGRLVYSDGVTSVEIASNVDSFHMSGDGSAVIYLVTAKYEHGIGGDLYYYDCPAGESQLIAEGAGRLFAISPCGDSISYTIFYEVDNPDALTCYTAVIGNDPTVLDTDSYCAAISDDARIVYYLKKTDEGEILTVKYDDVTKQLSLPYHSPEYRDQEHSFFFNNDQTQIVFNSGGATFFSKYGSDPFKISESQIWFFAGLSHYSDVPDYLYKTIHDSARSYITISVYGTKNLCYVPFLTVEQDLLFFNENMIATQYSLEVDSYFLQFSGNSLICSGGINSTIYIDYQDPDTEKITCVSPCFTEDQTLYSLSAVELEETDDYTDLQRYDLYVSFGSAAEELVASNIYALYLFEKEGPDILYFLTYPEDYAEEVQLNNNLTPFLDLYAVEETPGAKPVLVAKKVNMVETGDFGVIYRQYKGEFKDDFESSGSSYAATVGVFFSKDGTSFQYVMERPYVNQFGG